jgi:hypothetical protein
VRALAVVLVLAPTLAQAYDFQIDATTVGQGYQLRAADDALVNRRRITQYVGLSVFNLGPRDPFGRARPQNQIYLTAALRFDAELGDFPSLRELPGRSADHQLLGEKLDLLYAYIAGDNMLGFLDFQLGRQIMVDLYDWSSFDGLHLQLRAPFNAALEAWGGLDVSGANVFDSPIYRVDGTALGGNPLGSLGQRQEEALRPTFGVAARTVGLRDVDARVSYSRTMSPTGGPRLPGEPAWGVVDEKVGLTARGRLLGGRLVPWFAFRYNLLVGRLDEVYAGARAQLGRHGVVAEYVLAAPTFDGDSIWNVFASQAFDDVRLSYDLRLWRIQAYVRAFCRLFFDDRGSDASTGGAAGARLDLGRGWARLDGYYEDGYGGRRAGIDASGRVRVHGSPDDARGGGIFVEARLSYASFRDDVRPLDHADSFGAQAGLRYTPIAGVVVHGLLEENVNRLYHSQLRLLALLDLSMFIGQRPHGLSRRQAWSGF